MVDTKRTKNDLVTNLFQDGQPAASITPNDLRDLIVSTAPSVVKTERGIMDYNDALTAVTPITLASGVRTKLTNNELGGFTNKTYKPDTVTDLWNASTNRFDFSELNLGDVLFIRIDVTPTTGGANSEVELELDLAIGGSPYTLPVHQGSYKASGAQSAIARTFMIYMGDTNTLNNPAELYMTADSASSVIVNGWAISVC